MEVHSMNSSSNASKRIVSLLDDNSFVEVGALVTARSTSFNQKPDEAPSDGVVTGYGTIEGNLVFVYSQDASVLGGSIGEMHAKKITGIYDLATKTGAPVIGLIDSAGLRLQEATDALNAFSSIYAKQAAASGVIPQITAVFGKCGGGLALVAGMSDFTFMADDAKLFVNAPNALAGNAEDKNDTSAACYKAKAGAVDGTGSEEEVLAQIRELVAMLPSNNEDDAVDECADDLNRVCSAVEGGIADPSIAVADIADNGVFFEIKKDWAKEMAAGFIKLNGQTIGVIANRSAAYDENGEEKETFDKALTSNGCYKAEALVKFCDAFEIPVVTLTNVKGFAATEQEEKRIATAAAKLTCAFAETTSPKVNVIVGEAIGSAYSVMNSKATGADLTFAFPTAKIGIMDSKIAAKIIAAGTDADTAAVAKEYDALQNSIDSAAARGYVDQIVEPADLRKYLIGALEMLYTKREDVLSKKHSTK